ncbi:MAG: histidine phosphatase family protein [Drouetiella hepatica Uher 2000/2452]|uniref:Histidine phosphatase family protein n=1 Tax=Drouetiella hepatica Uher 2000/2452 TaxID=904376 RepID=A0A951QA14_9CYAN|nr:histidine phosphatase family protein [Drouetiella hepatica Uher 2000/2452]
MKSTDRFFLLIGAFLGVVSLSIVGCTSLNTRNSPSPAASSPAISNPAVSNPDKPANVDRPSASPSAKLETPAFQRTGQDIWAQMRQGTGYVVLLRHAQTVDGTGDPPGFQLNDCATQRNLSEAGRQQAIRIGKAFRDRGIPIRQVLSSQYCRCLDTARLLDLGEVESSAMLNSTFTDRGNEAEQSAQVRQQILNHLNTSGVIVMVSHFVNIGAISGVNPPAGGAVVVRTNQQGNLEVAEQIQGL